MKAVFTVLRGPRRGEIREIDGTSLTLGRGEEADWQVATDRVLSRLHCQITFSMGGYDLTDLSTNGVILNSAAKPLGQGVTARLASGDRIDLGPVELIVRLVLPSHDDDPFLAAIIGNQPKSEAQAAPSGWHPPPNATSAPWNVASSLPPLAGESFQISQPSSIGPVITASAAIPDDWLDERMTGNNLPEASLSAAYDALVAEVWALTQACANLDSELATDAIAAAPSAKAAGAILSAEDGSHRRRLFHTLTRMFTQAMARRGMP